MRRGKKPTRKQKIRLGQAGLSPENWLVVKQKQNGELVINFAIRSNYSAATNAEIITPAEDVVLEKDKVITLGSVSVTVRRE